MVTKSSPQFAKETDLCAAFMECIIAHNKTVTQSQNPHYDAHAWTAYPETAGWDVLLVSKHDGTQVGIEAKLKLNVEVLCQAIQDRYGKGYSDGPDFRAVLVPSHAVQNGVGDLASGLGVTVIRQSTPSEYSRHARFEPELPRIGPPDWGIGEWSNWLPHNRERLPEYVPDVIAGDKAPVTLSAWKIQALKITAILEERPVTRFDFVELKISSQRWTQEWLMKTPEGWVKHNNTPDFAAQHPTIYVQVKSDKEKWMPKPKLFAHQLSLTPTGEP